MLDDAVEFLSKLFLAASLRTLCVPFLELAGYADELSIGSLLRLGSFSTDLDISGILILGEVVF